MNILIVSQYFWPENFRINDFANGLIEKGHGVTVLTGIPNYPSGEFFKGYSFFKPKNQYYNGIKLFRTPLINRGDGNRLRLFLNYISFALFASVHALFIECKKFDIIFVHEPSPITVGIPAIVIKKLRKIPIVFWVLDLWPESISAAGNLNSKIILKIISPLVKLIYNYSDRILVTSHAYIPSIVGKGISKENIDYFPQWAESIFRPLSKINIKYKTLLPNGFIVMFAGNIGEAQDFESILRAADLTRQYANIHWVVIGDGRKKQWVMDQVETRDLKNTFHLLGKFPLQSMPQFYAAADVMLISLKKVDIFSVTVPAKIQSYLACGKPIVSMMDGEGSRIIDEAKAGLTCPAETPKNLADNVIRMNKMRNKDMAKMGRNARKYYNGNFERSFLLTKAEELFNSIQSNSWR